MGYFYGPVASRRLGKSLGLDLFSEKTCSFDCVYCQLGRSKTRYSQRVSRVNLIKLKKELAQIISKKPRIDFITFSGSGEPTLHENLDQIIKAIKKVSGNKYRLCLITNSSLLYRKKVREELKGFDLIVPSLDAVDAKTFRKINHPLKGVSLTKIIQGLIKLRKEFKGEIWLEVMLVRGINDSLSQAKKLKKIIAKIKPDKVQLNLPVRPGKRKFKLTDPERLAQIKRVIGKDIEIVSDYYDGKKEFKASGARIR
ncbi:MAG: radical SAM protein [Candidatus Omnitrophica bacterium]|nr:radical SAM protein [Candidatus Omnitrophota bacterium]MBU2043715.1 radical SAM protein [Candidatus Omnitrophota bacterium]MBU2250898.1 radical SAM protein [Candidatus Omnitrophota bacterium]MBU2265995.1 radical SAM protein [Candidatus Omnitrophota bacterium]MBU2474025.1 radical SAM protein [Candidatus Omnitrophota bacterium]